MHLYTMNVYILKYYLRFSGSPNLIILVIPKLDFKLVQLVLSSIIMLEVRISRVGDNFSEHERIIYFCFTAHIGTVNATVPTAQNLSQTITSTGVVGTTIPLVPATMVNPGMTMVNPWMTMATSELVGNIGKQIGVQKVTIAGTFNNIGSQIGVQVGRKKRAAQFNNLGSQIGQQIDQSQNFNFGPMPGMGQWGGYRFGGGFGRSQFNNYGSQIGQQFGRKKRSPKLQSSIYY